MISQTQTGPMSSIKSSSWDDTAKASTTSPKDVMELKLGTYVSLPSYPAI